MIVFGGRGEDSSGGHGYNDVWILANANGRSGTPAWTLLSPAGSPPPVRWMHGAGYDAPHKVMFVFGGMDETGTCLNDVWQLSHADGEPGTVPAWTQLHPTLSPEPRGAFISAYAPGSNRFVVAGGTNCAGWLSPDAYTLGNANGLAVPSTWSNLAPSGSVPVGSFGDLFGSSIYDPVNDRLMFWGSTYPLAQFVILSSATGSNGPSSWNSNTLPTAPTTAATGPTAVYSLSENKAVFFGGGLASGASGEVWGLGNANGLSGTPTWTEIEIADTAPSHNPEPRFGHTAAYDAVNDKMIVFGGASGSAAPFADAWVLDDATAFDWTRPAPTLTSVTSASGGVGTTLNVTLTGADFVPGLTTVVVSGTGVTANNVNVTSSTGRAVFSISPSAMPGPRDVTVVTSAGTSGAATFTILINRPPVFTLISPATAAAGSVANVTLTGRNFVPGATTLVISGTGVTVGTLTVADPTTLTATLNITATASPSVGIAVTTSVGTSALRVFVIGTSRPVLSRINPDSGSASGPVSVILSGAYFIPGQTSVAIAGSSGVSVGTVNVLSASSLMATFTIDPAAVQGPRGVTVSTPVGTSAVAVFTVSSPLPSLNSISPASGSAAVPSNVTITGTNFIVGAPATVYAGTDITVTGVTVASPNRLTATLTIAPGAAPGSRGVTVSTSFGTSVPIQFSVLSAAPRISVLSPNRATPLGPFSVIVMGANFVVGGGATTVYAGTDITVTSVNVTSPLRLTATFAIASGAAPGSRGVTVSTFFGTSAPATFIVMPATPGLTGIKPNTGNATTAVNVTLTGSNFVSGGGTTQVYAGTDVTVSDIRVMSSVRLTAIFTIDSAAATGPRAVTVSTSFGTSSSSAFVVTRATPSLTGFAPTSGNAITAVNVILGGTNFVGGVSTTVNAGSDVTVSNVQFLSPTSLSATFTVASGAATGPRGVTVSTSFGTSSSRTFMVTSAIARPIAIIPNSGNAAAPVNVIVTGVNFVGAPVTIYAGTNVTVSNLVVLSTSRLTARLTIGAGAALGPLGVVVSTSFGTSVPLTFTVTNPVPALNAIAPSSGSSAAPTDVTLTGANFMDSGGSAVTSAGSGVTVSNVIFISPTRLTARLTVDSDAALGPRSISVSTVFGTSGTRTFIVTNAPSTLAAIAPNHAADGSPVSVSLTGTGFVPGQTSVHATGSGITITGISVTDSTTLTATFTIASGAAPGPRNITVTTLLGTSNATPFTVD